MSPDMLIGLLVFAGMIALVLLGVPIFVSMLAGSFVGFILIGGVKMMVVQFTTAPFSLGANYTYAVLPLFMLVGSLASVTGIAQGAFDAMHKWLGRVRGGLLYTVVCANALFGACSGISVAGNVVFGRLAVPQLERQGYDKSLSYGTVTGAGVLSSLIPPSIPIIMWCLVTNMSIGNTLMYGLSAGLMMVVLLCLFIFIYSLVKPNKVPDTKDLPKIPFMEKVKSLRYVIPILLVFALIIGGAVWGWFPSTVGGAVAVFALLIYALIKRVPLKQIGNCIWDAAIMNAGMFPIIMAGTIFSRFIALTGLADGMADLIAGANLHRMLVFTLVIIFYLICGCVMDIPSIIIITVPVIFPLLTSLGFNEYVLCVMLVFMCDVAGMTPPIGMNVFAVSNALKVRPMAIFKGCVPFFILDIVCVYIMALFPQIVEFLPKLMGIS